MIDFGVRQGRLSPVIGQPGRRQAGLRRKATITNGSYRSFPLDNQNACLASRMGHVLVTFPSDKYIRALKQNDFLRPILTIVHVDCALDDDENLNTVIPVPFIRLIGPMQPSRHAIDLSNVFGAPSSFSAEIQRIFDYVCHSKAPHAKRQLRNC
jgi:hypothetical protein